MEFTHQPVLLKECIEGLQIKKGGIYVDGTLGGAGHSLEIAKKLENTGLLIGIDRDEEAILAAKQRLSQFNNIKYIQENHDNIKQILENLKLSKVNGILLDLGISSYQIDNAERGFSYMQDAILDMRMDKKQKLSAKTVVNTYKEEKLAKIIYEYGEERFSRQIARKIVQAREEKTIETTKELVQIIESAVPAVARKKEGHPAKRTFQAIRIEVNNEIQPLYQLVTDAIECLEPEGRLCIITFHSLEDRAVKNAYQDALGKCTCPKDLPYCICGQKPIGKIINKKPILPTEQEQKENARSRSAKLRILEKI